MAGRAARFGLAMLGTLSLGADAAPNLPRLPAAGAVPNSMLHSAPPPAYYRTHSEIRPPRARLGERVTYVGEVLIPTVAESLAPTAESVRFVAPDTGGAFSWGRPRFTKIHSHAGDHDTVRVEIPLQVFALGRVRVPGLAVWLPVLLPDLHPSTHRLPVAQLDVEPLVDAADTTADLKPLRGPLAAPWWERVSWLLVAAVALALALIVAFVVWMRRRRKKPVVAVAVAPRPVRRDPVAEALAELAALRRLGLPELERFAEHAFLLTRLLRRFLEATRGLRPGLATPELAQRLAELDASAIAGARAAARLPALLPVWDRIKFARESSSVTDAKEAERAVEVVIRASLSAPTSETTEGAA